MLNPAVPAILVGVVKAASAALCQVVTVPVLPLNVKAGTVPPEQIVWFELTVPPTDAGVTVINTEAELAGVHVPF